MKRLLVLVFTILTCSLLAQDSSSVFYKNQVGIDILPIITALGADNYSLSDRVEITYRRAFSSKYYGAFRFEHDTKHRHTADLTRDTISIDTVLMDRFTSLAGSSATEFSFVLSRKFNYKKISLYTGLIGSFSRIQGFEITHERPRDGGWDTERLHFQERNFSRIGYGLELGVEFPITKRFHLLLNTKAMMVTTQVLFLQKVKILHLF
jgi:hypothetical protein